MTDPTISIAMATYNGARFIREQLDSLAAQSLLPCELVVCDDGSADSTVEIVEGFAMTAPFPVRIHRNPERVGYADNFLKAARLCVGDWTAFCDQDDSWLPEKLEVVAAAICRHPEVVLVTHPAELVDEALQPTGETAWPSREMLCPRLTFAWRFGMGSGQVFRTSLVREIPCERRFLFDFSPPRTSPHDVWIARLSQCVGSCYHLSQPLVLRRRHAESVTWDRKPTTSTLSLWPAWDISDSLLNRSRIARDQADVLAQCAVEASPVFSSSLQDAANYFEEISLIFEERAEIRRMRGVTRYRQALKLLTKKSYWRTGQDMISWRGRLRDFFELFGNRVGPTGSAKP